MQTRDQMFIVCFGLQTLCSRGAQMLQSKSINVEDAANELINMLCIIEDSDDVDDHDDDVAEQTTDSDKKHSRTSSATPSGRKTGGKS